MQRITITLDDRLVHAFETFLVAQGYGNRSEAVRDLIRERLDAERMRESPSGHCVAILTYVYDHNERELATRLTHAQHGEHDLAVATVHVHLDHDNCMETVILRGPVERVQAFAHAVIAEPGVRHGRLQILPVEVSEQDHGHGVSDLPLRHVHLKPIS